MKCLSGGKCTPTPQSQPPSTEIQQRLTELYVEAAGEFAIPYGGPDGYGSNVKPNGPEYTNDALSKYLNMRKVTIYGGSNEIQKNIISKFVLGV